MHNGRIFGFSQKQGKLAVTEITIKSGTPGRAEHASVLTDFAISGGNLACCSLGPGILLMWGNRSKAFAALLDVEGETLESWALHFTRLSVRGDLTWADTPFLCQISETRAALYFYKKEGLWCCDTDDNSLVVGKLTGWTPLAQGFAGVPVCLPDGKLVIAGSLPGSPDSAGLAILAVDSKGRYGKMGYAVLGHRWHWVSTVLVWERFLVGFGGWNGGCLNSLWVFDVHDRKGCMVAKGPEWHPPDRLPLLAVVGDKLCVIGGYNSTVISAMTLEGLEEGLSNGDVQKAFRSMRRDMLPVPVEDERSDDGVAHGCFQEEPPHYSVSSSPCAALSLMEEAVQVSAKEMVDKCLDVDFGGLGDLDPLSRLCSIGAHFARDSLESSSASTSASGAEGSFSEGLVSARRAE